MEEGRKHLDVSSIVMLTGMLMIFGLLILLVLLEIFSRESCSICGGESHHRKVTHVHCPNGVMFNVCDDCLWRAFKHRLGEEISEKEKEGE